MTNNKKDAVNNVRNILEVEPVVHREQLAIFCCKWYIEGNGWCISPPGSSQEAY